MSTFQTLLALVILIFVLSVIVQALQEALKSLLNTKAKTMAEMIEKFMGDHLTLPQVQEALQKRGLDLTALENFSKQDFRQLLDGIQFQGAQMQGVVAKAGATLEEAKDNVAASYDAARASFQKAYTAKNKAFAVGISLVIVLALNASLIRLYEIVSADQAMSQAIAGTASTLAASSNSGPGAGAASQQALAETYSKSREAITQDLQKYPVLLRTNKYPEDFARGNSLKEVIGLFLMSVLVSLGAPFWNDVLKSMMGINNALSMGADSKPTS
jgi:hypothetical protein